MKPSGPELFFVGRVLATGSISLLVIVLLVFPFAMLDSVLVGSVFLGTCPFHLVVQFVSMQLFTGLFHSLFLFL